jgi:hypothetical protein
MSDMSILSASLPRTNVFTLEAPRPAAHDKVGV